MAIHVVNYSFGAVPISWKNNEHRTLDYHREPFNNPEDIALWKKQGFTHTLFTGEMYDMRNTKPEWFDFAGLQHFFPWKELSWSFYKMTTGTLLPEHVDTYKRFKELYPEYDPTCIHRAVIMLEDWKPGHVLTVGDKQMFQWHAGDFVSWKDDVPHMAANAGLADRYTLQLTGFKV